ncbi:amidohydrolase family protein [Pseudidiomarina terrestris]|uniref:Amidohydrolase family protein n=1 Tax=Pseudidiomarina terrestris TaxID=2820060 RepID=A0AAW7QY67_9GAMM|nr:MULTISPECIES: amidohydrolase family protein [unclassified Pseudidiomarina]MDN7125107.1 amidohydrolase family protein [Pseudidiomarina sp. 1APP75-32.1]MDN7129868.1 amidohydrolase family protein [Pseudidiomarina sp. 1APR75-15]MDN7136033.1 amidohydrolase family protein [Pseudidiomarina sp. 1ASP75-5]MEA3589027.1 amidohydrolase family protein [Pseudidiomarina sp. 1APP75-27a]
MIKRLLTMAMLGLALSTQVFAAPPKAPPRGEQGEGPYQRLILRGVTVINGEGAPPQGPVDIVIENDRITNVVSVGNPGVPILPDNRPQLRDGDKEMDLTGHYVLPGFVDMHGHIGGSAEGIPAEYVLKLWLAHGITTVREPGSFNGLDWTLWHQEQAEENKIVSPRIIPYLGFGMNADEPIFNAAQARDWVRATKREGAAGIKFFGARPEIIAAALDEADKQGLGTMMHHAQLNVVRTNVVDSARMGLGSMEHWYGLPEAMFTGQVIQDYPADYNYNNEQDRFAEAGKLWQQAAEPGSDKWNQVRDELIALDFTINPTLTIYEASRDLMRERQAIWHDDYTLPQLWDFFEPSRYAHGSYWFDWTTDEEVAWRKNYQKWMAFLNDFKNKGGRITTGSDAGYIYKIYGFGLIREFELLREAGFNALEVIQAATLNGAEALGLEHEIGSVVPGKKADLVVVAENPLANFKVLYGTGHFKLNENNQPMRTEGVRYTIKDGIVYDAQELLADVRKIVEKAKAE